MHQTTVTLTVDSAERTLTIDTRSTLLDTLREQLSVTSVKKGCDHGQCGACTVLVDGRRTLSCLQLTATSDGSEVVTAAGLEPGGRLHEVQEAFVEHDGLQCGYCTPGQVCSAVGMIAEARAGHPSAVTDPALDTVGGVDLTDDEIRERMSGNLCRCGAYPNILAAIREVSHR